MSNDKLQTLLDWADNGTKPDKYGTIFRKLMTFGELEDKIQSLIEQPSKAQIADPWCYDIDKTPEEVHILIYLGNNYVIEAFKDEKGSFRHSYSGLLVTNDKNIKAWMPISIPKGETA